MAISVAQVPLLVHAFPTPDYYLPPEDVVAIEIHRKTRGHFNVIHIKSGLKADFYPSTNHPFFRWAMENRRRVRIGNLDFWIAPPEYVILWKMEFFREGGGDKHMRDIQGILAVMDKELDRTFLTKAAAELGLQEIWKTVEN